ncbi:hypothetical protein MLD38_020086 [Melastoma candidum]|uniref:Uncharacterized protein n=1 Tax=Melastoma candidum TaxID=119954 RepID=A0ACB9QDQ1_9MYRT|nr:hypothetical protein MLD38_020086 [Melastoma candidum]
MDSRTMRIPSATAAVPAISSPPPRLGGFERNLRCGSGAKGRGGVAWKAAAFVPNGSVSGGASHEGDSTFVKDAHHRRSHLESLFCYDNAIPEERIDKPVGVSIAEKAIGNNPRCEDCKAKGAVLCKTCAGSGLYVDAIMESQGIIVKIRCLGCGGTGNIMCSECGGRGHL